MATIHREFEIGATPETAWAALRNVGQINTLIPFLGEVTVEDDRRTCSLGDQGTLEELIVAIDDDQRRVAYSIRESPFNFEHHHASMQVVPSGGRGARFVWTTDVKPDGVVPALSEMIDRVVESLTRTLQ